MRLVIADTSPINYLLLIGHIDIIPALFERVILPAVVKKELSHPKAPLVVRNWISASPDWVDVRETASTPAYLAGLDDGEADAIALAVELHADLLLMDDEEGALAARAQGFEVIGTLGLLDRAAKQRIIDLSDSFELIKQTNFRYRQEIMDQFLKER